MPSIRVNPDTGKPEVVEDIQTPDNTAPKQTPETPEAPPENAAPEQPPIEEQQPVDTKKIFASLQADVSMVIQGLAEKYPMLIQPIEPGEVVKKVAVIVKELIK